MRRFIIILIFLIAIGVAVYVIFFRGRSERVAQRATPTPDAQSGGVVDQVLPGNQDTQSHQSNAPAYTVSLASKNGGPTGQARLLPVAIGKTLVSVSLAEPVAGNTPAPVRLHAGTCDAIGEQVAELSEITAYATEGVISRSLAELMGGGNRVLLLADPGGGSFTISCGVVREAQAVQPLSFSSMSRVVSPQPQHEPVNTGWAWW